MYVCENILYSRKKYFHIFSDKKMNLVDFKGSKKKKKIRE